MVDHMNDLGHLLGTLHKLVSDPDAALKLLEDVRSHIAARDEAVKAHTDLGNARRQLIEEKDGLAARIAKLILEENAHAKAKTAHDAVVSAHNERVAQFGRDRQEFDHRLANVVQRESALKQRDAALQEREAKVTEREAKVAARVARINETV